MLNLKILSAADKAEAAKSGNNIFDPQIQEIVNRVIKSVIASGGIPSHMEDDAAIDIYMELYRAADKFNPGKCDFINYSRMVVNRHAAFVVRKYRERNRLSMTSLDAPIDVKGHTLADVFEAEDPEEETTAQHVEKVSQISHIFSKEMCLHVFLSVQESDFEKAVLSDFSFDGQMSPNSNCI